MEGLPCGFLAIHPRAQTLWHTQGATYAVFWW